MHRSLPYFIVAVALGALLVTHEVPFAALRVVAWTIVAILLFVGINDSVGRPIPFLRWSFLTMAFSAKRLITHGQAGDGREQEAGAYVLRHARRGDITAVLEAFDRFAYEEKILISIGDVKGKIFDDLIRRVRPHRVLELGTYLGYSALRVARLLPPGGHVYSIERNPENAEVAQRIIDHAGASHLVTLITGALRDDETHRILDDSGFTPGSLDVLFIDHDKSEYVADLDHVLHAGWLKAGSVVLADNLLIPGAPGYLAFLEAGEGVRWTTRVHRTRTEYQALLPDVMLETVLVGASGPTTAARDGSPHRETS